MKKIRTITILGTVLISLFLSSCSEDMLVEKPRTIFTPVFFQSETGVRGGLTALYSHTRRFYGNPYFYSHLLTGTDEYTYGESANSNFFVYDFTDQGDLTPTSGNGLAQLWDNAFPAINTASGIVENAEAVGIEPGLVAEARFFRAFDYFLLVQTFGGVPLDLGAGNLAFNTKPIRTSIRNTVAEVYTIGIFPDLIKAIQDLPDQPRLTGTITKNVARLFLSKAYLTYGWWLENPNSIPTYPEAARTDPDGHDAQWYYQEAYNVAVEAIDNPGPYALQPTFWDVYRGGNERNSEWMFYADHTEESELYNEAEINSMDSNPEGASNYAVWMVTWNYTVTTSSSSNTEWTTTNSLIREASQDKGRPWTRMAPPIEVFQNTFAEKDLDSRYDGTFTTTLRGNWDKQGDDAPEHVYNANFIEIQPGDPVITFLDEEPAGTIDYSNDPYESSVGAGVLPGRSDFVVNPSGISRVIFPALWKLATYRTDNEGGYGTPNAAITRPFPIARFAEFYLIAAEAAVKGASGSYSARELVNVLRARAGKWAYDKAEDEVRTDDYSADMVAATPNDITIDYILEERSREFFGEGYRWYDLVRTQKWEELAGSYTICGAGYGEHTPETFEREILPEYYLRPIPQGQLDGMEATDEELDLFQNPGYRD